MFSQFTLQDLGSLGEFVGALGVVISLIYLARQMIQNTTSVRAASFNSMTENSIRLLEDVFPDTEFAEFLHRAQSDPSELTAAELIQWDSYMTAVFRHFGNLVYQYRVGSLDRQMWEAYQRSLSEDPVALSASVMDYLPAQLAAPGARQGDYYTSTTGSYDFWAVEYGYRPFGSETSQDEKPYLAAIASRSGEPGHAYATDEETRGIDADPHSGVFDYGNDLIEHAEKQADIVAQSWPHLVERVRDF